MKKEVKFAIGIWRSASIQFLSSLEQVSGIQRESETVIAERGSPNFLNFKLRGHRVARGAGTNFLISPHRGVFIKNKNGHPIRSREARV